MNTVLSFCGLCLLLILGKTLRVKIPILQKLYLPASVIAGVLGFIIIQVFQLSGSGQMEQWTAGWTKLPGLLINIVFAALFLGIVIPPLSTVWKKAGPQLTYGQIVAWGQYAVGLLVVMVFLAPMFNVPHLFGVIVPVGFEGGHGTAAAMRESLETFNFPEGADYALVSATAGITSAIILGIILINWAARHKYTAKLKPIGEMDSEQLSGVFAPENQPSAGKQTVSAESVDSLAFHLAILGLAILVGYGLKQCLLGIESVIPLLRENKIFQGFPLFPLCMIGGLAIQGLLSKFKISHLVDHELMQRWAGAALDFLVIAAISTIQIKAVAKGLLPLLIIIAFGIGWNIFCVMFLARRMFKNHWFERSIAEMGQSMGVTATGLLLLRAVDPKKRDRGPSSLRIQTTAPRTYYGRGAVDRVRHTTYFFV